MTSTAYDRNADGKDDVVYEYKGQFPWAAKLDNDFDGYFETALFYNQAGEVIRTEIDRGRAGRPDLIEYNALGRLDSVEPQAESKSACITSWMPKCVRRSMKMVTASLSGLLSLMSSKIPSDKQSPLLRLRQFFFVIHQQALVFARETSGIE